MLANSPGPSAPSATSQSEDAIFGLPTASLSALVTRPSRADVSALARRSRQQERRQRRQALGPIEVSKVVSTTFAAVVASAAAALSLLILLGGLAALALGGDRTSSLAAIFIGAMGVALLGPVILWLTRRARRLGEPRRADWSRWLRLGRFASTIQGTTFIPQISDPEYPGALFSVGRLRRAVDVLRFRSGAGEYEVGNYGFEGLRFQDRLGRQRGFVRIRLERALPNMVLVARRPRGLTSIPLAIDRDQVLSLEGDFNRYFTLHVPRHYERDALYVFAPDLMALLIDEVGSFDVEIVDQWMVLSTPRQLDLLDPAVHVRIAQIVAVVLPKTRRQTDRYRDDRVDPIAHGGVASPEGVVAEQGRRLKMRIPLITVLIGLVIVVSQILRILGNAGVFGG